MNTPVATIGHNDPPPFDPAAYEGWQSQLAKLAEEAGSLIDAGEIETKEQAGAVKSFLDRVKETRKQVEQTRKAEKQPHLDAGRAVDSAYKKLTDRADRIRDKLEPLLTFFLRRQEEEARKAREAEQKRLEEEARAAEEAEARAAARNDVLAEAEAEEQRRAIEAAKKEAAKAMKGPAIESVEGGRKSSLRKRLVAERITSRGLAIRALLEAGYGQTIDDVLIRCANAELRRRDGPTEVPGVEVVEEYGVS